MVSNNSMCDSPTESASPTPTQPCSVKDDFDDTGNVLTMASFVMGTTATLYLIGDFFIRPADLGFSIIRSAIFIMLGLAMGIIAQKKFKSLRYQTWTKASIIVNVVGVVFVIIVGFFHLMR